MSYIALLDCNNFFVSCERLFRPDLLGVPVVVLSSNDGCVVARSNEVKEIGVPMGAPVFKIEDDLRKHQVVRFSSNFPLYRDISARVMNVLASEVAQMEQYSVDEAFFRIDERDDVEAYIKNLKAVVEQRVGIPVSIGVAKTKTLAKVASSMAKKSGGTHVLTMDAWQEVAAQMSIGELWGVGGGLSARYKAQGIARPADLLAADPAMVAKLFGVGGTRLQSELSGRPAYPLERRRTLQDSIMSSRSFKKPEHNLTKLEEAVAYHLEQAAASLREMGAVATHIAVRLSPSRFGDYAFMGLASDITLQEASDDTSLMLGEVLKEVRQKFRPDVPYKKAGIVLSGLLPREQLTSNLFSEPEEQTRSEVWAVVDELKGKFGKHAIGLYGTSGASTLTAKNYSSGSQTTAWSDIPSVKAK